MKIEDHKIDLFSAKMKGKAVLWKSKILKRGPVKLSCKDLPEENCRLHKRADFWPKWKLNGR